MENDQKTFATFIEDSSNSFALAASKIIVEGGPVSYNPLLLYAEAGSGKTHLLMAIQAELASKHPEKKVGYFSLQSLAWDYLHAIIADENAPRHDLLDVQAYDVVMIEHCELFAYQPEPREIMLRSVKSFCDKGKQVVLTYTMPQKEFSPVLSLLAEEPLNSLACDIREASEALKRTFITRTAAKLGLSLQEDQIEALISRCRQPGEIEAAMQDME